MASPVDSGLTVADIEQMPDDEFKYELIAGELFVSPPPAYRHQYVAGRINRRFLDYTDEHGGSTSHEPGVRYSDADYVEPDVVLLAADAVPGPGVTYVDAVPALLVEVSSPSTRSYDVVRKRALYERQGVPEFWFVDLEVDRIEVYRLGGGRYAAPLVVGRGEQISPPHLRGLVVDVGDLLGEPE